jgi:hypothetical protein
LAYSNGIFRLDYVNGSNAARTALTSVAVTNNGGIIRCTKVAHGLVTGSVVTGSAFTTPAYNTTHIINRIDNDIFELFSARATGNIVVSGTPVADETFVVGTQTFTFKASRASTGQVSISSDNVQQAKNICAAIMTDIPSEVIAFVGTRTQPSNQYTVTIDNLNAGTAGNSTVLTESATGLAVSGSGTLAGGAQVAYSANDSGTITPFGGEAWGSSAWQDITSGATAARIAPGDVVIVAKSPAPIGCSSAQFTNLSKTVTLQALTSCSFANNGGGKVRVTKTTHNIYDTAIVTVSSSTDYDGTWKSTYVDANNFDLLAVSYVADRTGTVTPAFTKVVDLCETAWTGVNSGVVARTAVATDGKEGSYCMQITAPASPATTTEYAYYAITTTDYSLYDNLTFWLKNEVAVLAGHWKICLCSDNAGATIVDTFDIPAIPSTGQWVPFNIAKTGGGKLGNSIQSIALWSATVAPTASKYLRVDCFNACTTIGLNQQSLISKSSLDNGTSTSLPWWGLQSINGNTLLLDNQVNTIATAGKGYSGTTEIAPCYIRDTVKTSMAAATTTVVQEVQDSGTQIGGNIVFLGGFNTSTNIQDGETFFDGLNGNGYGIQLSGKLFVTCLHLNFSRYYYCVYLTSTGFMCTFMFETSNSSNTNIFINIYSSCSFLYIKSNAGAYNVGSGCLSIVNSHQLKFNNCILFSSYIGIACDTGSNSNIFENVTVKNNTYGFESGKLFNYFFKNLVTANNSTCFYIRTSTNLYFYNPTMSETTKFTFSTNYWNPRMFINKYGGDTNDNRIYTDNAYAITQTGIKHGSSALGWQTFITSSVRDLNYKFRFKIGVLGVTTANKAITYTAWVKKSHGTDIEASICVPGGQIAGVASDVESAVAGNSTGDVQLTISFTPTEIGVVEIYACSWWLANTADENVVFSDFGCSQAA